MFLNNQIIEKSIKLLDLHVAIQCIFWYNKRVIKIEIARVWKV